MRGPTEEASGFPVKHAVIARCDEQALAGANPSVPRQSCESILSGYLKNVNEAILSDMASLTFLTCQSVQIKRLHHSLFPITIVFITHLNLKRIILEQQNYLPSFLQF